MRRSIRSARLIGRWTDDTGFNFYYKAPHSASNKATGDHSIRSGVSPGTEKRRLDSLEGRLTTWSTLLESMQTAPGARCSMDGQRR